MHCYGRAKFFPYNYKIKYILSYIHIKPSPESFSDKGLIFIYLTFCDMLVTLARYNCTNAVAIYTALRLYAI